MTLIDLMTHQNPIQTRQFKSCGLTPFSFDFSDVILLCLQRRQKVFPAPDGVVAMTVVAVLAFERDLGECSAWHGRISWDLML